MEQKLRNSSKCYGYARISTKHQSSTSLSTQRTWLEEKGVSPENIYEETFSAIKNSERPMFRQLLLKLKPGDVLYVQRLDRFSRSFYEGIKEIGELAKKNIQVISSELSEDIPENLKPFFYSFLIFFAELEAKTRKERQTEALDELRLNTELWSTKFVGRKPKLTSEFIQQIQNAQVETKNSQIFGVKDILKKYHISRSTYYKAVKMSSEDIKKLKKQEEKIEKDKEKREKEKNSNKSEFMIKKEKNAYSKK